MRDRSAACGIGLERRERIHRPRRRLSRRGRSSFEAGHCAAGLISPSEAMIVEARRRRLRIENALPTAGKEMILEITIATVAMCSAVAAVHREGLLRLTDARNARQSGVRRRDRR